MEIMPFQDVKSLPSYIFKGLPIESIIIPESIDNLGYGVFDSCVNLSNISFPMHMTEINDALFNGCLSLKFIVIPEVITYFGRSCFCDCPLENITICPQCRYIGSWAFSRSKNISIVIPADLDYLGACAFANCPLLTTFDLALKSNFVLRSSTFRNCSNFTTIINEDAITEFGSYFFDNCSKLSENYLTERHRVIVHYLYQGCPSITTLTIPKSIVRIGNYAFAASGLTHLTIPFTVKIIGQGIFYNCSKLVTVNFEAKIKKLEWYTFTHCTSLREFTPPPSVVELGGYCFYNCTNITHIDLNIFDSIRPYTFYNCISLPNLTLLDGLTTIDSFAIANCSSLTKIFIPNSVKLICNYAFASCYTLPSIVLPSSLSNKSI